jgi:2,3-bisphosphoglycerate-dependent phosphoglycerate mutase
MTILFIRHGETALNAARTLQPANTPLSANGLAQAQAVANRLATLGIVHILSSDLPRALQTAQAIAAATGAPVETTALLHERNFGDLRGQPYDALGFDPLQAEDAPPGGESGQAFRDRVARAFAQAVQKRSGLSGRLAVVTHGLVIRAVIERHLQLGAYQALPTDRHHAAAAPRRIAGLHAPPRRRPPARRTQPVGRIGVLPAAGAASIQRIHT